MYSLLVQYKNTVHDCMYVCMNKYTRVQHYSHPSLHPPPPHNPTPPPFSLTVHHKIHQRITPQHHQQQSNATFQRSFVHTIPHRVSNRHSQPQRHKRHQCQPHLDKNNIKTKRKKQPVRPSWSLYSSTMVNDVVKKQNNR